MSTGERGQGKEIEGGRERKGEGGEREMLQRQNKTNERVEGEERKRILSKIVFSSGLGQIPRRLVND